MGGVPDADWQPPRCRCCCMTGSTAAPLAPAATCNACNPDLLIRLLPHRCCCTTGSTGTPGPRRPTARSTRASLGEMPAQLLSTLRCSLFCEARSIHASRCSLSFLALCLGAAALVCQAQQPPVQLRCRRLRVFRWRLCNVTSWAPLVSLTGPFSPTPMLLQRARLDGSRAGAGRAGGTSPGVSKLVRQQQVMAPPSQRQQQQDQQQADPGIHSARRHRLPGPATAHAVAPNSSSSRWVAALILTARHPTQDSRPSLSTADPTGAASGGSLT